MLTATCAPWSRSREDGRVRGDGVVEGNVTKRSQAGLDGGARQGRRRVVRDDDAKRGRHRATASARPRTGLVPAELRQALLGATAVVGGDVVADEAPSRPRCGDRGGADAHEGVQHDLSFVGVELDAAVGQLHGEGRRVADPPRRLGGEGPDALRVLQELDVRDGGLPSGQPGAAVGLLAEDQDVLVGVPQGGVGGGAPAAPCGGGGGGGALVPDDFASHEKTHVGCVLCHVQVQGNVGPPAQVGDVDAQTAARHQDPVGLRHHPLEQAPVVREGEVLVVLLADVVGGRGDGEVDGAVRQLLHTLAGVGEDAVSDVGWQGSLAVLHVLLGLRVRVESPAVEGGGVVAYAPRRAEGAGVRAPTASALCPAFRHKRPAPH